MKDLLPLFCSHYSLDSGSLLTLDEPGKAKPGAPLSVFDLAQAAGLQEVVVVDERIDGFIAAFKASEKAHVKLCYGIKLVVCQDLADKVPASAFTESKVIVFIKDTQGYSDLIRIWNRAWTTGHFTTRDGSYGRIDWRSLKELWTPHLMLALPYFSSFLAKNTLTVNRVVPDLPDLGGVPLWVMKEVDSRLPFVPLIDLAIDRYMDASGGAAVVVPSKTIYYAKRSDFRAYVVRRCIGARSSWDAPDVDHLSSAEFCLEAYKELIV